MRINKFFLKRLIISLSIFLLAFSFPIQVILKTQYFSILPYLFLFLLYFFPIETERDYPPCRKFNYIDLLIIIYLAILFLNTSWQFFSGDISISTVLSLIFNFAFPAFFYHYFMKRASFREFISSIYSISLAGISSTVYYIYDSVSKLLFGNIPKYAQLASDYTRSRMNYSDDFVILRSLVNDRSWGLFESHTISSSWTILGFFAALVLIPKKNKSLRYSLIICCAISLLITLNITSIACFIIILFVVELNIFSILKKKVSKQLIFIPAIFCIAFLLSIIFVNKDFLEIQFKYIGSAIGLISTGSAGGDLYTDIIQIYWSNYLNAIAQHPIMTIIGDSFYGYVYGKGGDIGYIETLARLGIPFFLTSIFFLIRIVFKALSLINKNTKKYFLESHIPYLQFSITIIILILVYEIHYSIWTSKSILPILFFGIGMYQRLIISINFRKKVDEHNFNNLRNPGIHI